MDGALILSTPRTLSIEDGQTMGGQLRLLLGEPSVVNVLSEYPAADVLLVLLPEVFRYARWGTLKGVFHEWHLVLCFQSRLRCWLVFREIDAYWYLFSSFKPTLWSPLLRLSNVGGQRHRSSIRTHGTHKRNHFW